MDTFKNGIGQTVNSGQISMEVKPFERQHGILNQEGVDGYARILRI